MKTNYTPAPWKIVETENYASIETFDGFVVAQVQTLPDAQLIAAAPELLEAVLHLPKHLIDIADILRTHAARNGAASVYDKVLEQTAERLQKAIAKATGETQTA